MRFCRKLLLITALALLMSVFAGCSSGGDKTLYLEVDSIREAEGGMEIVFDAVNNTGYKVSLGWVGSCTIEITTTEDTYYYEPFMTEISRGKSSFDIWVEDAQGEVEKIVFTELCQLNNGDGNLPGYELHDVVVYDRAEDVDSFEGSFGLVSGIKSILKVLAPIWLVAMVVLSVIFLIRHHKRKTAY